MTIEIVRATGLCTIQDLGRRGHMHEAVPPGGALVPELLIEANRAVRNPDDAPAIEVLGRLVVRCSGHEEIIESEPRRVAYFAVRGGLDVPRVLDGHGTLLCAGIGRPLRAGDVLAIGNAPAVDAETLAFGDGNMIDLIAGPDLDAFPHDALEILQRGAYRIEPTSNRVGTRLGGAAIPRISAYRERSRPMVVGALEIPADGMPIVLGPEHPTTGGYPVVAVVSTPHIGRLFATRLGGMVRFRIM